MSKSFWLQNKKDGQEENTGAICKRKIAVDDGDLDSGFLSVEEDFNISLQKEVIDCLQQVRESQGDLGPLLQQLKPELKLGPTLCTNSGCVTNKEWLQKLEDLCEHRGKIQVEVSKALMRVSNEYLSNISLESFQNIYLDLLQQDPNIGKLLQTSVETAGGLDVNKLDLHLFASLIACCPEFPEAMRDLAKRWIREKKGDFYRELFQMLQEERFCSIPKAKVQWCRRELLHALLVSVKRPHQRYLTFHHLHGHEIFLPVTLGFRWAKTVNNANMLLQEHAFVTERYRIQSFSKMAAQKTDMVMWYGPVAANAFLTLCSTRGFPHISRHLRSSCLDTIALHQTATTVLDPDSDKLPHIPRHANHPLKLIPWSHEGFKSCSLAEPWLFRLSGALSNEWTTVARDLGFSDRDVEETARNSWYSHQHRMFHLLKRMIEVRGVTFTELCFLLLSRGQEYKCYPQLNLVVGAALAVDVVSNAGIIRVMGEKQGCKQQRTSKRQDRHQPVVTLVHGNLGLVCDSCNKSLNVSEIKVEEVHRFLGQMSLAGPAFNLETDAPGTHMLLFLPKYPSSSGSCITPSAIKENLELFFREEYLNLKYPLLEKLQKVFDNDERELVRSCLELNNTGAVVDLTLSKGRQALELLWDFVKETGALIRDWPQLHCNGLHTSTIQIAHGVDGNVELFLPFADTKSHVWVLLDSCSLVMLVKRLTNWNRCEAYCLLYKPVGRNYIQNKMVMFFYLIRKKDGVVEKLNKQHKGHEQVFKENVCVAKNAYYIHCVDSQMKTNFISIMPKESEFNTEMMFTLCLSQSQVTAWPIQLQLVQSNDDQTVFNKVLTEMMLQHEKKDYILVEVHGEQHCVLTIHREITYEQFRTGLDLTFPEKNLAVYYKEKGCPPMCIDQQNSIDYMLGKIPQGNIVLKAEDEGQLIAKSDRHCLQRNKSDRHFLQRNKPTLISRITEIRSLIEELQGQEILNQAEYEMLISVSPLTHRVRETLNCVIKKGNHAMDIFHSLLEKHQPYLLKEIESAELSHSSYAPGQGSNPQPFTMRWTREQ